MRSSLVLIAIILGSLKTWAGPFEIQLMPVPVQGIDEYRFLFPKYSNESEADALAHYFVNLKAQPSLGSLVTPEFRRILGVGKKFPTGNMRRRILILANADYHHTTDSEDLRMVAKTLTELGKEVYALPVSSMSGLDAHDRRHFLNLLRKNFGVLITLGGADVHFSLYGKTASPVDGPMNLQRDLDEVDVVKTFIYSKTYPHTSVTDSRGMIAICRGCQKLAVVLGYELVRDIPTQVKNPLNHQRTHLVRLIPTNMNLHHPAFNVIAKGPYAQRGLVEVLSRHHQAVKFGSQFPGKGLQLAALASDGVAEAFETDISLGLGPAVGTQHHPEYHSKELRKRFFSQILGSCGFTFNIATPTL